LLAIVDEAKKYFQARKKHFDFEFNKLRKIKSDLEKRLENKQKFSSFLENEISKKKNKTSLKMDEPTLELISKLTFSSERFPKSKFFKF
jgi:hypothetical protein